MENSSKVLQKLKNLKSKLESFSELEVKFDKGCMYYKVKNMPEEIFQAIGDDCFIALARYRKRYALKRGGRVTRGRKYCMVDDGYSEYTPLNIGDIAPITSHKIYWTSVEIIPADIDLNAAKQWAVFPYHATDIINRFIYFVDENNRLSNIDTALTKTPFEVSQMLRVSGKRKRKTKIYEGNGVRISYSLSCGIVACRKVGEKKIMGQIAPFRVCLSTPKGSPVATFKTCNTWRQEVGD